MDKNFIVEYVRINKGISNNS